MEIRGAALTETGAPQTKVVNDYICYFFLCYVQIPGRKKLNGGRDYFGSQLKSLSWQGGKVATDMVAGSCESIFTANRKQRKDGELAVG